jgi:putative hydrolase of the HAD superfamily
MRFAELDAVTVDGYGTLLVLDEPSARLREALAARGFERSCSEVESAFAAEARYYRPRSHLGRDSDTLRALRRDCVAVFLEALAVPLAAEQFVDDFLAALVFTRVPGAAEALIRLAGQGLELAVVANWDCALPEHLQRLDLDGFFTTVVTSAAAGAAKPDPEIFRLALTSLGVEPARAVHVGDERIDEEGALGAGMRFAPAPLRTAFAGWS